MEYLVQNWWYILLMGAFAFMMFRGGGCCGGGHAHGGNGRSGSCHSGHNGGNSHNGSGQMNNQIETVQDPVCGMYVNPDTAIKQEIDGKMYYFCSEHCRSSFMKKHLEQL